MRIQNLCATIARYFSTHALLFLLILAVSTNSVFGASFSVANTDIRDTWTNPLPEPITDDLSPDAFMLNSDRVVPIFGPFQMLQPDPLTMQTGRGEGLAVTTETSTPAGFHDVENIHFEATFGVGHVVRSSVVGLVTNYVNSGSDHLLHPHYRFQFGTTDNANTEDRGFSIVKHSGTGSETVLFHDPSVGLDPFSVYDFKMARNGVTGEISVDINNVATGFFGAGPGTGHVASATVFDGMLGPGAVGLFQQNVLDGQWDNIVVPEPNAMALAGMGCLGLLVFYGLRQRRQVAVDALL